MASEHPSHQAEDGVRQISLPYPEQSKTDGHRSRLEIGGEMDPGTALPPSLSTQQQKPGTACIS